MTTAAYMTPAELELNAMLAKEEEYMNALDRIRNGGVSPEDVHIILTHPSPASGLSDE